MKWLETSPKDYDRGIQLLTLGKIQHIKEKIANNYIREGMHVLEIGCGTGFWLNLLGVELKLLTASIIFGGAGAGQGAVRTASFWRPACICH